MTTFDGRAALVRALKISPEKYADLILLHARPGDVLLAASADQVKQGGPLAFVPRDMFGHIYAMLDVRDHARLSMTALFSQIASRLSGACPHKLILSSSRAYGALCYAQRSAMRPSKIEIYGDSLAPQVVTLLATMTSVRELTANLSLYISYSLKHYSLLSSLTKLERLHITHRSKVLIPFASFTNLTDLRVSLAILVFFSTHTRASVWAWVGVGVFMTWFVAVATPTSPHDS